MQTVAEELLPFDGSAVLHRDFFDSATATRHFESLMNDTNWESHHIVMFGKKVLEPRLSAWHSIDNRPYTYSGLARTPQPFSDALHEIRLRCEAAAGARFNSVLVNLYRDGKDSMGWHADDERENGRNPVIASVSLGGERRFDLRHRDSKHTVRTVLTNGSLLVMSGETQHKWVHQVPRTARPCEPRINLTFRLVHDLA